jgi:hypothetical protein
VKEPLPQPVPSSVSALSGVGVKSVACGSAFTASLLFNGSVWVCGGEDDEDSGSCLGLGSRHSRAREPTLVRVSFPFFPFFLLSSSFFLFLLSSFFFLSYFLFLISYFLFLISYFFFLLSSFLFLISSFLFLTSYFLFLISSFFFLLLLSVFFRVFQIQSIFDK